MTNKKLAIFLSIIGVVLFMVAIASVSYAFYTANVGSEGENKVEMTTAQLITEFVDTETLWVENMIPGDYFSKDFSIKNTGTILNYKIVVEDLINDFTSYEDIQYALKENGSIIKQGIFPNVITDNELSNTLTIESGETKSYELIITYQNTEVDQSEDMGKTISGKINLKAV